MRRFTLPAVAAPSIGNTTALATLSTLRNPKGNANPFFVCSLLERFDCAVGGVRDNPQPLTGLIDRLMMTGIAALRASPENARQRARFLHKNRVPPFAVAGMPKNRIERIG